MGKSLGSRRRDRAALLAALTVAATACDAVLGINEFPAVDAGEDATAPPEAGAPRADGGAEAGDATAPSEAGDATMPSADAGDSGALDAGDADASDGGDASDPVVSITVGSTEACAVTASGALYCWGPGPVGNGTNEPQWQATRIALPVGNTTATDVSAGDTYACVLVGGHVSCWGINDYAQLSLGSSDAGMVLLSLGTPTPFPATSISCGATHACLANVAGGATTSCWGSNSYGELGHTPGTQGDTSVSGAPVTEDNGSPDNLSLQPSGTPGPIALGDSFSCEIFGTQLYCWGNNASLQLNSLDAGPSTPDPVASLANVVSIAAGANHACAFDEAGVISCWGDNSCGQLGWKGPTPAIDASSPTVPIPTLGVGLSPTQVAAGGNSSCAIAADATGASTVWCWGANEHGQLGHDPSDPSHDNPSCPGNAGPCNKVPDEVVALHWFSPPGTDAAAPAVAVGPISACALKPDQTVWCWGSASLVGNGVAAPDASTIQFTPVQVQGLPPP